MTLWGHQEDQANGLRLAGSTTSAAPTCQNAGLIPPTADLVLPFSIAFDGKNYPISYGVGPATDTLQVGLALVSPTCKAMFAGVADPDASVGTAFFAAGADVAALFTATDTAIKVRTMTTRYCD